MFIEQMAALLAPWGMPSAAARLYGYLVLKQSAVTIDEIAAALKMSRAGAWNAARLLEQSGHARRSTEPGNKRVYFRQANDVAPLLLEHCNLMAAVGELLQGVTPSATTPEAAERLNEMAKSCFAARDALDAAITSRGAVPGLRKQVSEP